MIQAMKSNFIPCFSSFRHRRSARKNSEVVKIYANTKRHILLGITGRKFHFLLLIQGFAWINSSRRKKCGRFFVSVHSEVSQLKTSESVRIEFRELGCTVEISFCDFSMRVYKRAFILEGRSQSFRKIWIRKLTENLHTARQEAGFVCEVDLKDHFS